MISFILKRQPKAYQGSKTFKGSTSKDSYQKQLKESFEQYNSVEKLVTQDLYGLVYYFYKKKTGTDADNISKPIWDCLKGIIFEDDKQVKVRTAGVFDLLSDDIKLLDMTGVPGDVIADLLDAFDTEDHIVYIECGLLNYSMYKFNLE